MLADFGGFVDDCLAKKQLRMKYVLDAVNNLLSLHGQIAESSIEH